MAPRSTERLNKNYLPPTPPTPKNSLTPRHIDYSVPFLVALPAKLPIVPTSLPDT